MILDHADAFNEIPLHPSEIPLCCADLGQHGFLVFHGMGFGGRSFPNVFGRVASFIARHTQGLFDDDWVRVQQFVDDPILYTTGPPIPLPKPSTLQSCLGLLWGAASLGGRGRLPQTPTH